jgi:hypothetical protein
MSLANAQQEVPDYLIDNISFEIMHDRKLDILHCHGFLLR